MNGQQILNNPSKVNVVVEVRNKDGSIAQVEKGHNFVTKNVETFLRQCASSLFSQHKNNSRGWSVFRSFSLRDYSLLDWMYCTDYTGVEDPSTERDIVGNDVATAYLVEPYAQTTGVRGSISSAQSTFNNAYAKIACEWNETTGNGTFQSICFGNRNWSFKFPEPKRFFHGDLYGDLNKDDVVLIERTKVGGYIVTMDDYSTCKIYDSNLILQHTVDVKSQVVARDDITYNQSNIDGELISRSLFFRDFDGTNILITNNHYNYAFVYKVSDNTVNKVYSSYYYGARFSLKYPNAITYITSDGYTCTRTYNEDEQNTASNTVFQILSSNLSNGKAFAFCEIDANTIWYAVHDIGETYKMYTLRKYDITDIDNPILLKELTLPTYITDVSYDWCRLTFIEGKLYIRCRYYSYDNNGSNSSHLVDYDDYVEYWIDENENTDKCNMFSRVLLPNLVTKTEGQTMKVIYEITLN